MESKQQHFIRLLNLLPEPCSPTTKTIDKLKKEVDCSYNTAYTALRKLRKMQDYGSIYQQNDEYKALLKLLHRVMKTKYPPPNKRLSQTEIDGIKKIERIIGITKIIPLE